jgi:hypothetical protein
MGNSGQTFAEQAGPDQLPPARLPPARHAASSTTGTFGPGSRAAPLGPIVLKLSAVHTLRGWILSLPLSSRAAY